MAASGERSFDAADLGLEPDTEAYQEICEHLGSPPWSLSSVKALFDDRSPGWDGYPELAVSSPVSRFQFLSKALQQDDCLSVEEALRELDDEVKHVQIRTMTASDALHEEVNFLALLVGELGAHLLDAQEARRTEGREAAQALKEADSARRSAYQEAYADAKAETKKQIEDIAAEADSQQRKADALAAEKEALQAKLFASDDFADETQALRAENRSLQLQIEGFHEELQEAKARCAAMAVAHEESEGAVHELTRRLQRQEALAAASLRGSAGGPSCSKSDLPTVANAPVPASNAQAACDKAGHANRDQASEAFLQGAKAALAVLSSSDGSPLRPIFLAWRCARWEAKFSRLSAAAAAESLEADLTLAGQAACDSSDPGSCGREGCCCRRQGGMAPCCRKTRLQAALEALEEQKSLAALAEQKLQDQCQVTGTERRGGSALLRLLKGAGVSTLAIAIGLQYEPYMSGGW
eukprot:TRINITY_DN107742_c0_g1_i1.p1 TRINITY_DN107742_c0_g1~~TRINITY_DN107742_c0_g1_i1.p1  ORF type:complete len:468 (-),score=136.70 TRINITY_DN107742_c0_g1_i1:40-1443(-)